MSTMKLAGGAAVAFLVVATLGTDVYAVRSHSAAEAALRAENGNLAALAAEVRKAKAQALAAEREAAEGKQKVEVARAARLAAEAKSAAMDAAGTGAEPPKPYDPGAAGDAFMAKHPTVKEALGDYARARVNFRFGELYARLGLTPAQIARFQTLVAGAGMGAGSENGPEMQLFWNRRVNGDGFTSEMNELLGDEGMKLYQQLDMRDQGQTTAVHIAGALWFSETPITPVQRTGWWRSFRRRRRSRAPTVLPGMTGRRRSRGPGLSSRRPNWRSSRPNGRTMRRRRR